MIVDFGFIMFAALVVTGVVWMLDRLFWAKKRESLARSFEQTGKTEAAETARREPALVEYARAFFPVILVVFVIRSFLVEPFRIPSGSMMPTLFKGDFILVNKFSYGIRLPIVNVKLLEIDDPKRGDVAVFRFPGKPPDNYIKRVIGVPGDRVVYKKKQLFINGEPVKQTSREPYTSKYIAGEPGDFYRAAEDILGKRHDILVVGRSDGETIELQVPAGHYFVMGDNRDHSNDSRYWGFVPDSNLVGRAFLVWFSLDPTAQDSWFWQKIIWTRIGDSIN